MSGQGVEHRAARVSLITGLSTILSIAFQLISVPVCLRYWGQETYGSWLALMSAFLMLRALDGGYIAYVGNKLNYLYHQDIPALRRHLASSVTGIATIGCLQLALAAGALLLDPLATVLGMATHGDKAGGDRVGLLLLMASWVLTGSYLGIVHRLLIPAGLMFQAALWSMLFQVSQFIAIMVAAVLHFDIVQTSALFALSQFVNYVASGIYVARQLPGFYPWWRGSQARVGIQDLLQSLMLTTSSLIQQGSTNGVVLLVAAFAGPAGVPVFATVRTLANLWVNVSNVLTGPLLPEVVRYHAHGEPRKLLAVNQSFWVVVGTMVNGSVLLLYPLLPWIYGHWTRHAVAMDSALLCLLLAAVVTGNAGALMTMYLNGINSLRIGLATSIVRALLSLGVGALGYTAFGMAGFGIGILSGELTALAMTAHVFFRHELARQGLSAPIGALLPNLLSTGTVLLFLAAMALGTPPLQWLWPLAASGVVAGGVWGWAQLDDDIKRRIRNLAGFGRH